MPRFPFRADVGQDLRDLYAHDRLTAQPRGLGLSSITQGEGSLDLLDAGGAAVARMGDAPTGSGFGVLVPDGAGGWRTVQADAQARADVVDARVTQTNTRVTAVEGRVSTAEGRLDSHASRLGAAEGRLDSHASRLGATEAVAGGARSELNAARGGFGSVGARLNSHSSRIGATEGVANGAAASALLARNMLTNPLTYYSRLTDVIQWLNSNHPGWDL